MPVGRVFGIRIGIDPSWIIIAALLVISLSAHFAALFPQSARGVVWAYAAASSGLFFASILAHELSHSYLARLFGLPVHGITLFIFGGVSELGREPRRPLDELLIAAAGPLASAFLGALFLAAGHVIPAGGLPAAALQWLGTVNLGIALFNLLPGFPLDGGRVLRAVAWALTSNLKQATNVASASGVAMAYALMILGGLMAIGLGLWLNGLWFAFIGWFLLSAAQTSRRQAALGELLDRIRVDDVMRGECPRVRPTDTVQTVVHDHILRRGARCLWVAKGDALLGLVTLHEIKHLPREEWDATSVRQVMVPLEDLRSLEPADTLKRALEEMDAIGINQLPVLEEGRLVGVVTREDLIRIVTANAELRT